LRDAKRRIGHDRAQKSLGRRRAALDVDVLALRAPEPLTQTIEQLRSPRTEVAEHHRNARWRRFNRGDDSPLESGASGGH